MCGLKSVKIVSTGEQAIRACERNAYNIVFIDIGLGTMDGFTVLRILKHMLSEDYSPLFVIVTADQNVTLPVCRECGAHSIIYKPVSASKIRAALRDAARSKVLSEENARNNVSDSVIPSEIVLKYMSDMIEFLACTDLRTLYVNDAFTANTNYSIEDVLEKRIAVIRYPVDVLVHIDDCARRGSQWAGTFIAKRADGSCYTQRSRFVPGIMENGTLVVIGIHQPIH